MKTKKNNKLFNLYGCANRLDIPPAWLKKMALSGEIPYLRIGKRQMRFELNAVKEAVARLATHTHTESRYLTLKALAVKLGLPENYLGQLAKSGAIPFLSPDGKMMFDWVGVVDSLARLNPQDKNIDKVIFLYEELRGLHHNVTAKKT